MKTIREFLQLIRYGQASLSVAYYDNDVRLAKEGLARALNARDAALADMRVNEPAPTVPAFLVRTDP